MDYICSWSSPLGPITLASDGESLTGLWFEGQQHFGETMDPCHREKSLPVFDQAVRWLDLYFSGIVPDFTPPLALRGSGFRKAVWKALQTIPYGITRSYADIARQLNSSPRAVGGAIAHNPVSLIVPCHRVIASDGRLTGYAGGLNRKKRLLAMEQAIMKKEVSP